MKEDEMNTNGISKESVSLLEKAVEIRYLILALTTVFYIDIWMLTNSINPTTLTLENIIPSIKATSIHKAVLFIMLYSLLMSGFFPFIRKISTLIRMQFQQSISIQLDSSKRHLSNWSFALISFAVYDVTLGLFYSTNEYSGMTVYIFSLFPMNGVVEAVIRLSVIGLIIFCLSQALSAYDEDFKII